MVTRLMHFVQLILKHEHILDNKSVPVLMVGNMYLVVSTEVQ